MIQAFGAAIFFAASATTGKKLSGIFANGSQVNLYRLICAWIILGVWAVPSGHGFFGSGWGILWLSGVIGFGIGDVALFFSLRHLGARLTVMMIHCLATPLAAFMEWVFLGTTISLQEALVTILILTGVIVSLGGQKYPNLSSNDHPVTYPITGWLWGLVASLGQAGGAVMSRAAYGQMEYGQVESDPFSVAWIRILGGICFSIVFLWCSGRNGFFGKWPKTLGQPKEKRKILGLLSLNGFLGPAAGVSLYQWALLTTPTALVLPVVALTPVILIPLSLRVDGIKPTFQSILGGILAIMSVVILQWIKS